VKWTLVLVIALLASCGETGIDPDGPYKATLILRANDGSIRDFYIGGSRSQNDCLEILKYEINSAQEHQNQFWTNPDFTYGGFEEPGWNRNYIVGTRCDISVAP